jgi:hypothetical protein
LIEKRVAQVVQDSYVVLLPWADREPGQGVAVRFTVRSVVAEWAPDHGRSTARAGVPSRTANAADQDLYRRSAFRIEQWG